MEPTVLWFGAGSWLFDDALNRLVDNVIDAATDMFVAMATSWIDFEPMNLAQGGAQYEALLGVRVELDWLFGGLMLLSVLIGGARMAWEQRAEPGRRMVVSLVLGACVYFGSLATLNLLISASDKMARGLLGAHTGHAMSNQLTKTILATGSAGPMVVTVIALVAILITVTQMVILVLRSVMLMLMVVILPISASFTNTELGRSWFTKICGWTLAFLLYKPVAAVIYLLALNLIDSDYSNGEDDGHAVFARVAGLTMLFLAILALPALMKACVPAVSAAVGGGSLLSGLGSGGGGGGGKPSGDGPTGAAPTKDSGSHDSAPPQQANSPTGAPSTPSGSSGPSADLVKTGGGSTRGAREVAGSGTGAASATGGGAAAASSGAGGGAALGGAGAGGGAAASAGTTAAAGAATGGVGAAVMIAAQTAVKAAKVTKQVADNAAGIATGEGPSGSR